MKNQPVLVVMAAGMGSRYGGLKQIDPLGPGGQIILDYSLFDARRAGFERVVFIIKPELEEAFEQAIGRKARRFMQVDYAYQTLETLPEGLTAPEGRVKPLGTGHAVWCVSKRIDAPFAVINADDFYGADAFAKIYDFLSEAADDAKYRYCMVGYPVENTLTE
ncbi:MAG: NDP-sugar synthase, partial [Butyricicoccus sp.]